MKRKVAEMSGPTMYRWSNAPISCRACRSKKRKCDREQPCSNCRQRGATCEYESEAASVALPLTSSQDCISATNSSHADSSAILNRLARLEKAVFNRSPLGAISGTASHTHFRLHANNNSYERNLDANCLLRQLPPLEQARILFEHFAKTLHKNMMILHIPLARDMLEQVYSPREEPARISNILLLLCMFAGSALTWSPELLLSLQATLAEAKAAFHVYTHLAMAIVDHPTLLTTSTSSLAAMTMLSQIVMNSEGLVMKSVTIRARCLLMAREMQIHYLDSPHKHDQSSVTPSSEIEKEVQRRAWWNLVGSDWLSAFSAVYSDGVYNFHPRHMTINYPKHVDEIDLLEDTETLDQPLSQFTDSSAAIYRIKLAEMCREIADCMPWTGEDEEGEYAKILSLDQKFRGVFDGLPIHFKLDEASIRASRGLCTERPELVVQRLGLNFSIHNRRCRLHRAYHLKGMLDSRYAFSRITCVASAQKVLELRQAMEKAGPEVGFKPARFWIIMQHVILATLVLATDVSWDPVSPEAKSREEKVLAAYRLLERSKEEASGLIEGLQSSMQKIMARLREKDALSTAMQGGRGQSYNAAANLTMGGQKPQVLGSAGTQNTERSIYADPNEEWDPVWNEFLALVPDLNEIEWNTLFNGMDVQI